MGKIIELDKSKVRVIQPILTRRKVLDFLISYLEQPRKVIVSVRENPYEEGHILLDGHSRAGVIGTLSKIEDIPLYGFVAKNEKDLIENLQDGFFPNMKISDLNLLIQQNFKPSVNEWYNMKLEKLLNKVSYFKSPEKLIKEFMPYEEFEELKKGPQKNLLEKIKINKPYKFNEKKSIYSTYF